MTMKLTDRLVNILGYPEAIESTSYFRGVYEVMDSRIATVMMVAIYYVPATEFVWADMTLVLNGETLNARFGEGVTDLIHFSAHTQAWATRNGRMALTQVLHERRGLK